MFKHQGSSTVLAIPQQVCLHRFSEAQRQVEGGEVIKC
uniref:Uncharacterized protein n=1 Tax=Moniliophthora roreri TaxID=221103 RepID=A0A0W0FI41_MONRR